MLQKGVKNMSNKQIRQIIKKKRLRHYEVAKEIGISPYTLSVWLRYELSDTPGRERIVMEAIDRASKNLD